MVFISKVNNYMFRPKAAIFSYHNYNFAQRVSYIYILHSDVEENCNFVNLKMAALGRNM